MALQLPLRKDGVEASKLSLNLAKGAVFVTNLAWDSTHDLDVHALLLSAGKVTAFERVLSTYNNPKTAGQGACIPNGDGSFQTPCGSLKHSGDARDGRTQDVDESITIDTSKIPADVDEIPIFITIHSGNGATFAQVKAASIAFKDEGGKPLGEYVLSNEFTGFTIVQMGILVRGANGWEYLAVGNGLNGDFNTILNHFS